jgi:hypothetical protein
MPKQPTEKEPLLSATAVPVHAYQPESLTMSRTVQAEVATIEDFMEEAQDGLMIRERAYIAQVCCSICEKQTQFKVANYDPHTTPDAPEDSQFLSRPASFQVRERSECLQRYCCHQLRELELGVFPVGGTMMSMGERTGWPEGIEPILIMEKPFKCPIVCCCFMLCPFEMQVRRPATTDRPGEYFGRTVCNWRWFNSCWPCDTYMNVVDGTEQVQYVLHRPDGCGSCCINCCAPTCFNKIHRTYILDPRNNMKIVGELQNVFPGCNARAFCMWNSGADNYIVKFPPNANALQKSLIMSGLFLQNFVFWERRANQN